MDSHELLVMYGSDYKETVRKLLTKADLAGCIKDKEMRIGIKPNLLGPIPAEEGATTHPEVVAGIIEYLREHGFFNLVVLESSWVGDKTEDSLFVTGFDKLLAAYDVPFWDLQKDKGVERGGFLICERVLDIDFLINVPVLKGHCQTKMTCSLKNMKGLLPASEKRRFHRLGLHEPIGMLSSVIRQDFIVVDGICGDTTFEDGGHPVRRDRLIAAADPVLCDSYGASLLGLSPEDVPYIAAAERNGIGSTDLGTAVITEIGTPYGEAEGAGGGDYKKLLRVKEMAREVDSCSACYASLIPALMKLEEEGLLEQIEEKICIGQGYKGKRGILGVGSCTRGFTQSLAGCPPDTDRIYHFLREMAIFKNNLKKE